jgi:DHA2 family multidrug resistance protein
MFVLGFVLFGTTVLIPQFAQTIMGYTAERAGLVISPGGVMVMIMMPLVGFLVGRVDARYLVAFGFAMLSAALARMHSLDALASYSYLAWLRVFQAAGLAFLFVPINTLSYTDVPLEKNNDVSGLTNLARNIGGSAGTSFFVTELARRSQFHQERLAPHLTDLDMMFRQRVDALARFFTHIGGRAPSMSQARQMAQGNIYGQLITQSTVLAYLDVIAVLALGSACMIPLVFFMKKRKAGAGVAVH